MADGTAGSLPMDGPQVIRVRGRASDPDEKTETIPTLASPPAFWKAVGKYGIAVPLLVYLIWWGCNGISNIIHWTGRVVVEPVVQAHTDTLKKVSDSTSVQAVASSKQADAMQSLAASNAQQADETRETKLILKDVKSILSKGLKIQQDDKQEKDANKPDPTPPGTN